jgi:ATP-dependent DNA ligase
MTPLFIELCLPTISRTVATGQEWPYEIKHDGFRAAGSDLDHIQSAT